MPRLRPRRRVRDTGSVSAAIVSDTEIVSTGIGRTIRAMPKAQHAPRVAPGARVLRGLRAATGLSQRALGARMKKPQSWVYHCESGNRRVDVAEFAA